MRRSRDSIREKIVFYFPNELKKPKHQMEFLGGNDGEKDEKNHLKQEGSIPSMNFEQNLERFTCFWWEG